MDCSSFPTDDGAELAPPTSSEPGIDAPVRSNGDRTGRLNWMLEPSLPKRRDWLGSSRPGNNHIHGNGTSTTRRRQSQRRNARKRSWTAETACRIQGTIPQDDLDAFTSARLLRQRLARINGRVRCEGTPAPLPGTTLELNGLGDRFSGQLLISAVRQTLANGVWQTDVQFGLPPEPLLEHEIAVSPASGGMLPAIHDLAIGVITGDQLRSGLRVARPNSRSQPWARARGPLWARLAKFDAGKRSWRVLLPGDR
jgi:hypothetical protein